MDDRIIVRFLVWSNIFTSYIIRFQRTSYSFSLIELFCENGKKGEAMKMNKLLNISKAELNRFEIKYVFVKKSISIC